jgi:hypothetical protein
MLDILYLIISLNTVKQFHYIYSFYFNSIRIICDTCLLILYTNICVLGILFDFYRKFTFE